MANKESLHRTKPLLVKSPPGNLSYDEESRSWMYVMNSRKPKAVSNKLTASTAPL